MACCLGGSRSIHLSYERVKNGRILTTGLDWVKV